MRPDEAQGTNDTMKETTLVHVVRDGCVLMMHRISKKDDINHGKWIGVGGKFEKGETPEECMRREVREETGLQIDSYRYCGIVTFVSDENETEYMHLFTVTGFHDRNGVYVCEGKSAPGAMEITLKKCEEGTLEWLPKEELTHIPHWAGDRIFLPLILDAVVPFFSMKLVYREGELIHASMNEHNCLVTDRLVLRPWLAEDADEVIASKRLDSSAVVLTSGNGITFEMEEGLRKMNPELHAKAKKTYRYFQRLKMSMMPVSHIRLLPSRPYMAASTLHLLLPVILATVCRK